MCVYGSNVMIKDSKLKCCTTVANFSQELLGIDPLDPRWVRFLILNLKENLYIQKPIAYLGFLLVSLLTLLLRYCNTQCSNIHFQLNFSPECG